MILLSRLISASFPSDKCISGAFGSVSDYRDLIIRVCILFVGRGSVGPDASVGIIGDRIIRIVVELPAKPDAVALPGLLLTVLYYAGMMYIQWRYGVVNQTGMIAAADFWTMMMLAVDFLLTMAVYVYTFPRRRSAQATGAVMSFLYMPVMMAFVCRTRNLPQGIFLYFLIFICASVSDVCALAVGMAIGRHKLAPVLSPKKTMGTNVLTLFLIIGICGSIIGQTGDLAASAIKRNHGIKDYGTLIPGHGGMMDRFDSILFTAPVIYYLSFLLSEMM